MARKCPRFFRSLIPAATILTTISCGPSSIESAARAQPVLDNEKAVVKKITAARGGRVDLNAGSGAKISVLFLANSLQTDSEIAVAPIASLPFDDPDVLFKGFDLVERGKATGPPLQSPAIIMMTVNQVLPADSTVASVTEDGGYESIPTRVTPADGKTVIMAVADHFSPKIITIPTARRMKPGPRKKLSDWNWFIDVDDTFKIAQGLNYSINVKMHLENDGHDIAGTYTGRGSFFTTSEGSGINAHASGSLDNIKIVITQPLASLDTGESTEYWQGTGSISMSQGAASGVARVGPASGGFTNSSSVPVTVAVDGDMKVTVTATFPQIGEANFAGTINVTPTR